MKNDVVSGFGMGTKAEDITSHSSLHGNVPLRGHHENVTEEEEFESRHEIGGDSTECVLLEGQRRKVSS